MTVMKHFGRVVGLSLGRVFFYFRLTFTFQLLDKLCSQASSLLPSGTCLQFSSRISFSIPTARRFYRMLLTHVLALSASQFVRWVGLSFLYFGGSPSTMGRA